MAFSVVLVLISPLFCSGQVLLLSNKTAKAGTVNKLYLSYTERNLPATPTDEIHFVAVGSDLDSFIHIHGQRVDNMAGSYFVTSQFPKAGTYVVGVNTASSQGTELCVFQNVTVTGVPSMAVYNSSRLNVMDACIVSLPLQEPLPPVVLSSLLRPSSAPDAKYHISLSGPTGTACVPGSESMYTVTVSTAKLMTPVVDLFPLMGHLVHIAVVAADKLSYYAHEHGYIPGRSGMSMNSTGSMSTGGFMSMGGTMPGFGSNRLVSSTGGIRRLGIMDSMGMGAFGPSVTINVTFPRSGVYSFIVQMQRNNSEFLAAPFYISCGSDTSIAVSGGHHNLIGPGLLLCLILFLNPISLLSEQ